MRLDPLMIAFLGALAVNGRTRAAERGTSMSLDDPVLIEARTLADQGEFAKARRLLAGRGDKPDASAAHERDIQLEILRRIQLDYSLTEEQMLARLRQSIPDATLEDVRWWRDAGDLQHRVIDGVVWYFCREPANLFLFCPEAIQRRDRARTAPAAEPVAGVPGYSLLGNVKDIVAAADGTDSLELLPVRHRATCSIALRPKHRRLKPGSLVRIWMIYPQEYRQQRDVKLVRATPPVTAIAPNWDEAAGGELQRTLYFEQRVTDPDKPVRAEAVYEWTCAAYYPRLDPARVRPYDANSPLFRAFTAERPPHIVFAPEVRDVVARVAAGIDNPLQRARRLWLWTARNIPWNAEVEYSTIPSLCLKGLRARRGDCGVQATTFITLCRAAGIPARWQSGWETKPSGYTMHDWAEFYVEPWGWLPADPSYGLQKSDDPRVREFFFGHMDAYRCIANLDYGCPLVPPKPSFRSEPIDFQRGEVEVDGENWYYDEWDYSFTVEWLTPQR